MIWMLIEPYVNEKGWSIPELALVRYYTLT